MDLKQIETVGYDNAVYILNNEEYNYEDLIPYKEKLKQFILDSYVKNEARDHNSLEYKLVKTTNDIISFFFMYKFNERIKEDLFNNVDTFFTDYQNLLKADIEVIEKIVTGKKLYNKYFRDLFETENITKNSIIIPYLLGFPREVRIKERFPDCFINKTDEEFTNILYDDFFTKIYILEVANREYIEENTARDTQDMMLSCIEYFEENPYFLRKLKIDKENVLRYIDTLIAKDYIFNNIIRRKKYEVLKEFLNSL